MIMAKGDNGVNQMWIRNLEHKLVESEDEVKRLKECAEKALRSLNDRLPEYAIKHLHELLSSDGTPAKTDPDGETAETGKYVPYDIPASEL